MRTPHSQALSMNLRSRQSPGGRKKYVNC